MYATDDSKRRSSRCCRCHRSIGRRRRGSWSSPFPSSPRRWPRDVQRRNCEVSHLHTMQDSPLTCSTGHYLHALVRIPSTTLSRFSTTSYYPPLLSWVSLKNHKMNESTSSPPSTASQPEHSFCLALQFPSSKPQSTTQPNSVCDEKSQATTAKQWPSSSSAPSISPSSTLSRNTMCSKRSSYMQRPFSEIEKLIRAFAMQLPLLSKPLRYRIFRRVSKR